VNAAAQRNHIPRPGETLRSALAAGEGPICGNRRPGTDQRSNGQTRPPAIATMRIRTKYVSAAKFSGILYSHAGLVGSITGAEEELAIFKKSDDEDRSDAMASQRSVQARPARFKNISIIASTLLLESEHSPADGLIIEGHLECAIAHHKKHLTVGKHARVKADVQAGTVTVLGQLIGDIYSDGIVSLAKGADVKGNIFCAGLLIDEGARFIGKINMEEPPNATIIPNDTI